MPPDTPTLKLPSGRTLRAYAARPDGVPDAPGVVVIHEIWGLDAHIRSVVDRLAEAGFQAIAPDLLGMEVTIRPETVFQAFGALRALRPEERAVPAKVREAMRHLPPDEVDHAIALMDAAFRGSSPEGLSGVTAAVRHLKAQGARKVGVMGFCLGGGYTWAYGYAGGEADALVPFYGRLPERPDPARVHAPILGHYGGADEGIPPEPLVAAAAAIAEHGVEAAIEVYPNAPHAFFNDSRDTYEPEAAKLAWERTLEFFREKLSWPQTDITSPFPG